ncbi:MAG: S-methyl-5-thioribose kinase [Bauldia sp.]|nr:S-methyl-5-thioribose kinase [Bauldia sp.]
MEYRQLTESTVAEYLAGVPELRGRLSSFTDLDVREVGDGNLNYVFIVTNRAAPDETLVVKQAVPFLRIVGESWPLSRRRMDFEIAALKTQSALVPEHVPEVFHASTDMSLVAMRNLRDHRILRGELIAGKRFPLLADHMSTFLARTLFHTSDFAMDPAEKKAAVAASVNTELCKITEDFVFTHPYDDSATNAYNAELPAEAIAGIQRDPELRAAVGEMKFAFMTAAEALVHGDLHTGSIMANSRETFVIDPEFAFYGPMGFDIGALVANFYLAYFAHAWRQPQLGHDPASYRWWLLETAGGLWEGFTAKFLALWRDHDAARGGESFVGRDIDGGKSAEAYRQRFMKTLLADTIGFAACKMMRRIVGIAKVADIATIPDLKARAIVETHALDMARRMVMNRTGFDTIADVAALARSISAPEAGIP